MDRPEEILDAALRRAERNLSQQIITDLSIYQRIVGVVRALNNRAGVRVLLACSLAKINRPSVDIRKPYTEIGSADSFSGRSYDEGYIAVFSRAHRFPVNPTTAFLTPALRNINAPLASPIVISGRPKRMYEDILLLLDDVYSGRLSADDLLTECIRELLILRSEQDARLRQLLDELATATGELSLSSEEIVTLVQQHLASKNASRLPVLIVTAAYQAASQQLGETAKPLQFHNAADSQTGSLGDIEITLVGEDKIVTTYEMKDKEVAIEDINVALTKLLESGARPDNYIFVTTEPINKKVTEYAASLYKSTGGIEFAVLDCLCFLRHFLHLFHRLRSRFLSAYQELVLSEPESAVSQPLKEVFLNLRRVAEYNNNHVEL